jgi:ATP-dependent protease HslVU (ClpYQ) peptidase subunit
VVDAARGLISHEASGRRLGVAPYAREQLDVDQHTRRDRRMACNDPSRARGGGRRAMSVIVVLPSADGSRTWIGSDGMICSGMLRQEVGGKWVVRPPWAVGVAGNLRTLNVLDERADQLLADLDGAHAFARRVRDLLKEDGYRSDEEGQGPVDFGQLMMLARPGAAWTIGCDFAIVAVPPGRLWAEGEGRELAVGAGHALLALARPLPEPEVLKAALEVAIALSVACGGAAWLAELSDAGCRPLERER